MNAYPELVARLERLLGERVTASRRVVGGYTPAARFVADLESGSRVFVKAGTDAGTSTQLRAEHGVYRRVEGSFMPELLGFEDDREQPMLVLEDLSGARWPPPWSPERVDAVRAALRAVHACTPPLVTYEERKGSREDGWPTVASSPLPFLSLGLCSASWLDAALPALLAAEASVDTSGATLTHWDVRSDNLCFTERGAVLVDWNHACLSNPRLDTGFWLPSLCDEGGPEPEAILPDAPDIAGWVSGFFAARAGLPPIPDAPGVRPVQRAQLIPALAWVSRALELPPLDPAAR